VTPVDEGGITARMTFNEMDPFIEARLK